MKYAMLLFNKNYRNKNNQYHPEGISLRGIRGLLVVRLLVFS